MTKFKPLKLGDQGSRVVTLQNMLAQALAPNSTPTPTGNFGPQTHAAVVKFQSVALGAAGVPKPGVVDELTWSTLGTFSGRTLASELPPVGPANWMIVARREMEKGVHEVAGKVHNEDIVKYHQTTFNGRVIGDETPWCSSFINWCFQQVQIAGTNSAGAASWVNWGTKVEPCYGCVMVIFNLNKPPDSPGTGNHVAFLIEETAKHYTLLGGNQSDSVMIKDYPKKGWKLKARRWPSG